MGLSHSGTGVTAGLAGYTLHSHHVTLFQQSLLLEAPYAHSFQALQSGGYTVVAAFPVWTTACVTHLEGVACVGNVGLGSYAVCPTSSHAMQAVPALARVYHKP